MTPFERGKEARHSQYNTGLNTSNCHTWETPREIFDKLNSEFGFTLDVCATEDNAKLPRYYTPQQDGLVQKWSGTCWMNPPYGREIGRWMQKAYESSLEGATVVCLVPSRTCSSWWHNYAMKGEVRFLRGRVKFVGAKWTAPFPCAVVVFRGGLNDSL